MLIFILVNIVLILDGEWGLEAKDDCIFNGRSGWWFEKKWDKVTWTGSWQLSTQGPADTPHFPQKHKLIRIWNIFPYTCTTTNIYERISQPFEMQLIGT